MRKLHGKGRLRRLQRRAAALRVPALALGLGLLAMAPACAEEPAGDFVLRVSAEQTMQLRINCEVIDGAGRSEERNFNQDAPAAIRFGGARAVACEVRDRRHVESKGLHAELLSGGASIARAQTDAIYQRALRLRSDGPWGPARAQACRVRGYIGGDSVFGSGFATECRTF